ncbi:hypothetical protein ACFL5V_00895 [Fibrobacterota bacterium]
MKMFQITMALLVCLALAAVAQYKEIEVKDGGTISGVVKKKGEIPKDPMLKVTADQEFCGEEIAAEHYVISAAGEIKYAAAFIEGIKEGAKLDKATPAFIDNVACRNEPRVIIAPKGGTMTYKNSDPINHTAHYYLMKGDKKQSLINQALPKKDMVAKHKKPLRKEGLVFIGCDPHDWEEGWIWVLPHPYGAVTDAKGTFKIENVPAGKHKLKVWHEKLGEKTVDVEVKAGAEAKVTVEF